MKRTLLIRLGGLAAMAGGVLGVLWPYLGTVFFIFLALGALAAIAAIAALAVLEEERRKFPFVGL